MVLLLFLLFPGISSAGPPEYRVKAAFLVKFTKFVEWPGEKEAASGNNPFIIGIIGRNPFEHHLEEIVSGHQIKGRNVEIRQIDDLENIAECHVLFVSRVLNVKVKEILSVTHGRPILTVGDIKGFAEKGGLINFYIEQEKVRFEINETEAHYSGLSISYLLLKSAVIVNPAGADR